ncbi:MAG: Crp/Fnr family transcriptional regulator [Anaerolineae bacterium]|nr:Crp/Fnr family transcriptional regulator [Anaerolineae bacterium]
MSGGHRFKGTMNPREASTIKAHIAEVATQRTYPPGALILVAGEPVEAVYFIISGEVRVYRVSLDGREQVLARLGPGQMFNTVPLFLPEGRTRTNAMAVDAVTLNIVDKSAFLRLVRTCPDICSMLLHDFAARLAHLTDLVEDLSLRSVQARLARFLLLQADDMNTPQRWTQNEMAAYLGTVRDMIGRALRAFADEGLIQMGRGRITLSDRAGLERVAEM